MTSEKGLCYYCDAKYTSNHKCQPSYYLLIGQELDELIQLAPTLTTDSEAQQTESIPKISFNALMRQFNTSTIRIQGKCGTFSVHLLIDSGSTHNIMCSDVTVKFKLTPIVITPFKVYEGSDAHLLTLPI